MLAILLIYLANIMAATLNTLRRDFELLGVKKGDLLMIHASVRSVGPVIGGVNVIIRALLDSIGPGGTLTAYVDFEPFFSSDDETVDVPVFDKRIAHAARSHGVLHEAMRTWPGALRSDHPDAGVVAIGARAAWITADHPFQYGYGDGTPFAKIFELQGRILLVGAPLESITLLHYAEHKALIPHKRVRRYRRLMAGLAGPEWINFEEFETATPVSEMLPSDYFERIGRDYLSAGHGIKGQVGNSQSRLFESPDFVAFAISWMERHVAESWMRDI